MSTYWALNLPLKTALVPTLNNFITKYSNTPTLIKDLESLKENILLLEIKQFYLGIFVLYPKSYYPANTL